MFGLATSQIATDVLAAEGLTARNVARWLATQDRLAAGPGSRRPQPTGDDEAWRLHAGDLVVVDESAMTDTPALAAIHRHVDAAGAKLLLVGDHRQLAAVGAGGGMDLLAQAGARYELADARRFTAEWEREASLRLRDGDETVLRDYHRQGRLLDAGTVEQAESLRRGRLARATRSPGAGRCCWSTPTSRPPGCPRSCAPSWSVSAASPRPGVPLGPAGHRRRGRGPRAGPPERLGPRRARGQPARADQPRDLPRHRRPRRRRTRGRDPPHPGQRHGRRVAGGGWCCPAGYVAEHLALGYASTVHAAQGATVDTSHTVDHRPQLARRRSTSR